MSIGAACPDGCAFYDANCIACVSAVLRATERDLSAARAEVERLKDELHLSGFSVSAAPARADLAERRLADAMRAFQIAIDALTFIESEGWRGFDREQARSGRIAALAALDAAGKDGAK